MSVLEPTNCHKLQRTLEWSRQHCHYQTLPGPDISQPTTALACEPRCPVAIAPGTVRSRDRLEYRAAPHRTRSVSDGTPISKSPFMVLAMTIDNPDLKLKLGMAANVTLTIERCDSVL